MSDKIRFDAMVRELTVIMLPQQIAKLSGEPVDAAMAVQWGRGTAVPSEYGRERLILAFGLIATGAHALGPGSGHLLSLWLHRWDPNLRTTPFHLIRLSGPTGAVRQQLEDSLNQMLSRVSATRR